MRSSSPHECSCVEIEKASVFKEISSKELKALSQIAARTGVTNVRLVKIKVIEIIDPAGEDGLKQSLYEMLDEQHGDLAAARKKWEDILLTKLSLLGENDFVDLAKQVKSKKLQPF
jgi:hypothetical protein